MFQFTEEENAAIVDARLVYPSTSQRQLARLLYGHRLAFRCTGYPLRNRSTAAIYSAIRRYDAAQKNLAKT